MNSEQDLLFGMTKELFVRSIQEFFRQTDVADLCFCPRKFPPRHSRPSKDILNHGCIREMQYKFIYVLFFPNIMVRTVGRPSICRTNSKTKEKKVFMQLRGGLGRSVGRGTPLKVPPRLQGRGRQEGGK